MSSLKVHTLQGAAATAALYPVIGEQAISFGLATVFIDLDHIIEYVRHTKSYDLRGLFTYCDIIEKNLDKNYLVLSVFHTIEFFMLMFCLMALFPVLVYAVAGMALHVATDMYHVTVTLRRPFARSYSIIAYLYKSRSKKYLISIQELLQQDNLNVNSVHNFQHWLQKWNFPEKAIPGMHHLPRIPRSVSGQSLPYKNGALNLLEKILVGCRVFDDE